MTSRLQQLPYYAFLMTVFFIMSSTTAKDPTTPAPVTINLNVKMDKGLELLRKGHHEKCQVNSSEHTRITHHSENETEIISEPVTIYSDPCDHPRLRMFMHCNTKAGHCECYRDWKGRHVTDMYDNTTAWTDPALSEEWFVYDHHSNECLIKLNKKCGTRSEVTPYRCEKTATCVRLSEDSQSYLCDGSMKTFLSWWNLLIMSLMSIQVVVLGL